MALYKWTSNKDANDNTEELLLEGRDPVRIGGEVELSDEEHDQLKGQLNLRKVGDESAASEASGSGQDGGASQASPRK